MKKLTNRELARSFGVSLTQIKRWAVTCLGRDPEADQSGGVRREYTIDDAFMIYLFGEILVRQLRMGLKEAKAHIDHIRPQLIAEKLLPSNVSIELPLNTIHLIPKELLEKAKNRRTQYKDMMMQGPFINLTIFKENDYLIEWGIFSYLRSINGKIEVETDSIKKFFSGGLIFPFRPGPQHVIFLNITKEIFMSLIFNYIKGNK
ncbi:MAG: hypothetical protein FJ134_13175 [Deltaproteobacteria bacterium]|nr:hypothetical protein [Deltaproteobacteria bacterium]